MNQSPDFDVGQLGGGWGGLIDELKSQGTKRVWIRKSRYDCLLLQQSD
ncbi:MAG: hypothetical protein Ct9H300mP11_16630 [Chloroflexota bacterium]|nr:MAG: hypothetical protein Ct9H300mP11_16630 [Chloroflexota bacterium]